VGENLDSDTLDSSVAANVINEWHRTAVLQQLCESPIHDNEIVLLRRVLRRPDIRERLIELISAPPPSSPESNQPSVDDGDDVSKSSSDVDITSTHDRSTHEGSLPQQQHGGNASLDRDGYPPRSRIPPAFQIDNPRNFPPIFESDLNNSPHSGILLITPI